MAFKSGFVAVVGRPNVGKSTLMNRLVGEKVAIMSPKPQTTRHNIRGIINNENSQMIVIDTPGLHKPASKLGDYMVQSALNTLQDADAILYLVEPEKRIGPGDRYIMELLEKTETPIILVINKIDMSNSAELEICFQQYDETGLFQSIIPISATLGENINQLIRTIEAYLPEGPHYFPEDEYTDQPERTMVAELIREKVLQYLEQEIPHGVAVITEKMTYREEKNLTEIQAAIFCEKKSHKGIIIGKNGRKLKGIGKAARKDIEDLLGHQVHLELWVKVKEGWRDQDNILKDLGYKE
ncbi:GTPase Era [Tindallia californiensis]|uniref:GTPase Era n=1 Tax=Tindallia californiensis TaxID=159292 RepID=A0A1H3IUD1_9FIRM|nr:GTPase Era [Tindallia californiensis]SDY30504.1 GTP-binding protein Era [Tindallia californiensis]